MVLLWMLALLVASAVVAFMVRAKRSNRVRASSTRLDLEHESAKPPSLEDWPLYEQKSSWPAEPGRWARQEDCPCYEPGLIANSDPAQADRLCEVCGFPRERRTDRFCETCGAPYPAETQPAEEPEHPSTQDDFGHQYSPGLAENLDPEQADPLCRVCGFPRQSVIHPDEAPR